MNIDRIMNIVTPEWIENAASASKFVVGIKNATDNEAAQIAIYGEIGDAYEQCDARSVGQFLRANKGRDVEMFINSMGGSAYDGIVIHNALCAHDGKVTTTIEGIAGSAASVIAMAGQPVRMFENAHLFIHRALMVAIGNVDAMDEAKDWLSKVDDAICKTYKAKTGKAYDKLMEMMRGKMDGTNMTAKEACDMKFCDEVISLKQAKSKNAVDIDIVASMQPEAVTGWKSVELARANRMRTHVGLFVPAGSGE